jgi:hypothetical protein
MMWRRRPLVIIFTPSNDVSHMVFPIRARGRRSCSSRYLPGCPASWQIVLFVVADYFLAGADSASNHGLGGGGSGAAGGSVACAVVR